MIIVIAAIAENNAIGLKNDLLWHLPNDFKRFKSFTTGHYIIMGRKTFESFPKPLPNRTHVIISRQENYKPEGCLVAKNIYQAIELCPKNEDLYIIGGGEIYNLSLDLAEKIELTRVHDSFEADTFFPKIDLTKWAIIKKEFNLKDEKHLFNYSYETYYRI